jgi:serine/threonine-protein kinase RIO1
MPKGDNPKSKESLIKATEAKRFQKGYKRSKESIRKQKKTCAEKRTFKTLMNIALAQQITDRNGEKMSAKEAMIAKAVIDAVRGDRFAREFCRDTAGEKPIERVMVAEVSQEVIDEVEAMVNDNT